MKKILVLFIVGFSMASCVVVKPYEMVYLNDPDMNLNDRKELKFEKTFRAYREGAAGANGGKAGGGCGCN